MKLRLAYLHRANFSSVNLMFTNVCESNFSCGNFSNAELKGIKFKGAKVNLGDMEQSYSVKTIMPDGTLHE